ncbi:MAG: hypothetical protein WAM46_03680, partial [Flavobacterium sp.]
MKKAIIICILVIGMMANAQTKNQITTKPLQLNTVNKGFVSDSVLVWGEDKVVKFIPKSEFSLGATPNIDQVLGAGSDAFDKYFFIKSSNPDDPYSIFYNQGFNVIQSIGGFYYGSALNADKLYLATSNGNTSLSLSSTQGIDYVEAGPFPQRRAMLGLDYFRLNISSDNGIASQTFTQGISGFTYSWNGSDFYSVKYPNEVSGDRFMAFSVNGNFADSSGNIMLSENNNNLTTLQSVINTGNYATNSQGDNLKLLQDDGGGSINRRLIDMTTNGVGLNINNTNIGILSQSSGNYQYGMLLSDSEGSLGMAQLNAIKHTQGSAISFNNQEGAIGIYGTSA